MFTSKLHSCSAQAMLAWSGFFSGKDDSGRSERKKTGKASALPALMHDLQTCFQGFAGSPVSMGQTAGRVAVHDCRPLGFGKAAVDLNQCDPSTHAAGATSTAAGGPCTIFNAISTIAACASAGINNVRAGRSGQGLVHKVDPSAATASTTSAASASFVGPYCRRRSASTACSANGGYC